MKETNVLVKVLLIVGLIFTFLGGTIFVVAMTANKWDFSVLATHVIEKNVVEITDKEEIDSITSVKVEFNTADVNVVYHDEDKITVEGYNRIKRNGKVIDKLIVKVENGVLNIGLERIISSYLEMGTVGRRKVTVKLPKGMLEDLSVKVSTGDVCIGEDGKDIAFKNVTITTSTGDVIVNGNANVGSFSINNSTGDSYINGNLTANSFTRTANTGDLIINAKIDAQTISVTNTTGDVICNTHITANVINIKTSTGDVTLKLLGTMAEYNYSYKISTGKSNIPAVVSPNATKSVSVTCSTGDSNIYFEK